MITDAMVDAVVQAIDPVCDGDALLTSRERAARAALTAIEAAGYVIVPREPTREMLDAAYKATALTGDFPRGALSARNKMRSRWAAMLAAAAK